MCCIFTCCGWMIDLFQRAWVFAMSCCISSAIACSIITASMSGVALGYNYSLAEYIELKETNVSVYLKRGVFDDEVVDEMDWRRGGGGPPAAARRSMELTSLEPSSVPDFPFGFRRANDEGMFATTQINEPNQLYGHDPQHHQFEGSLMKLTAKPTAGVAGMDPGVADSELVKVMTAYPPNSMEQLKAVQGLMNRRVLENPSLQTGSGGFLYSNPTMVTGSVPSKAFEMSTTSFGLSALSDEMRIIQKLLNDRKMAARKFESMKATETPEPKRVVTGLGRQSFPDFAGPMRRMGDAGATAGIGDPISNLFGSSLQKDLSKWYQPKQTESTSSLESDLVPILSRGPVTLSHTTTHRRIKAEEITLSQESFRRAMLDAGQRKYYNEKEVQNIINEQQKDYDEEDVKGFPVRKKRKKRNKRSNKENSKSINQTKTNFSSETGLFSKIMNILLTFKIGYNLENAISHILQEAASRDSSSKSSGDMSTDIVTSSYANIGAPSTPDFISKLMKTSVVS